MISVIVPVYNVEKYLDRCVDSLINQTYTDLEIILVDDGSTDSSGVLCDKWAEKDSRITVIHKENGGLSDARNAGMAVAKGEYISFIDSDDWVDKDFYSVLLDAIVKNNCDVSGCRYIRTNGEIENKNNSEAYSITVLDRNEMQKQLIEDKIVQQIVYTKLYKRQVALAVEFEKGKCNEDEFWTYQVLVLCDRYAFVDYEGYFYFQRQGSIMGASYTRKRLDGIEAKVRRLNFYMKEFPDAVASAKVNLLFSCLYNCQLALSAENCEKDECIDYLKGVIKNLSLSNSELNLIPTKQRVFAVMALKDLKNTAKLRNKLKIGI